MSVTGTNISLTLRQTKGSELTYAELDGNQSGLKEALEAHSHNEFAPTSHGHSYDDITDPPAIPSVAGLLDEAAHDALDHTGLTGIPTAYSLPTATTTVLGGVKIDGTTILISDGVISSTGGAGGGVTDHGLLTGLADDDHSQYHNDARGDARYSRTTHDHSGVYAPVANGVTNGDSHDHSGGDGAQIAYSSLSGLPTLGTISSQAANNVSITGGTINGTVGATTPAAGAFTTLSVKQPESAPIINFNHGDVNKYFVGYVPELNGFSITRPGVGYDITTKNGRALFGTTDDDTTGIIQAAGKISSVGFPNTNGAYNTLGASILTGYPAFGWLQQLLVEDANNNSYGWALSTTLAGTQSERVRVTGSGNVLMGTATNNGVDMLQVGGSISSTGLSVTGNVTTDNSDSSKTFSIYGATSGDTGGASLLIGRSGSTWVGLGNRSNLLGGGYSTAGQIYSAGPLHVFADVVDNVAIFSSTGLAVTGQYNLTALNTAPASATATGTTGEIRVTADYIYVCTATNTWKRTALTTW